jgi:hypothetical protein
VILSTLGSTLVELVLALSITAPEVTSVTPDPLPVGGTGQVAGSEFLDSATSIQIGGIAQRVVNVQPALVTFVVDDMTPEGAQSLTLTTPSGMATHPITIAPPNPVIDSVSPAPLVLGERATIQGERLELVTSISIGGQVVSPLDQSETLLQFTVPFDGDLLGQSPLNLLTPTGGVASSVEVVAPRPSIDAIAPNPVRRGDLITIRGPIAAVGLISARIGQVDAPIVEVRPMEVTAFVPPTTTLGPQDVTISVAQQASPPEGPLLIQAEDPARPEVIGVFPSNVAVGGHLWVIGSNLDGVTTATHGLEVIACERTACRLATSGAPTGMPITAAVISPAGAAIFTLQVLDETTVVPVVDSVSPMPATRGRSLTISGANFTGIKSVVIGGRTQSITDFDANRVVVNVALDTPLGAEQLFVSGNSGSLPSLVTVLDPLPSDDVSPDTFGDASETSGTSGSDTDGTTPGDSGGCAGSGQSHPAGGLFWLLAVLLVLRATRRPIGSAA